MRKSTGRYPKDWKELALKCKQKANWCCERCGYPNDKPSGHVLTVHHLDFNRSNRNEWDHAALCQRCHLHVQAHYQLSQAWLMDFSEPWMKPHQDGFYAWLAQKVKEDITKSLTFYFKYDS